jgi:hypothetical protein
MDTRIFDAEDKPKFFMQQDISIRNDLSEIFRLCILRQLLKYIYTPICVA